MQVKDGYTYDQAVRFARRIRDHWESRGYVGIRTQVFELANAPGHYGVRSNIGPNGFPPVRTNS